ncbi:hypothetical protein XENOCAPTIV_012841 [Xenoophorus captivus]|uniref:Mediator of RNA polymerase II transcription subunit 31 n=1 Tax=Xenoophorus captivus TaxID=1517983 RepID=A0ABV0RZ99_9TELE
MTPLHSVPPWAIVIILCLLIATFTECASNVATATLFLPILASMVTLNGLLFVLTQSQSISLNPLYVMIPCTLSASLAFMLPVATPPNAIVFSSGFLKVSDMVSAPPEGPGEHAEHLLGQQQSIGGCIPSWNTFELFIFCLFLLFVAGSYPVRFCPPEEQARNRFQSELEFVQCLANPNYLNCEHQKNGPNDRWLQHDDSCLQRGYLRDRPFINYLKYLLYWKEPEYAKFLKYPHCLHMLELLQYEHFRKELVNAQCAKFIDEQQLLHWQHYSRKRTRLQQTLAEQQQPPQQPPPPHGNAATK